jgi:hypothetical protein
MAFMTNVSNQKKIATRNRTKVRRGGEAVTDRTMPRMMNGYQPSYITGRKWSQPEECSPHRAYLGGLWTDSSPETSQRGGGSADVSNAGVN